jgi:hypothetical protein
MVAIADPLRDFGVALQRDRGGKECRGNFLLVEQALKTLDTGALPYS